MRFLLFKVLTASVTAATVSLSPIIVSAKKDVSTWKFIETLTTDQATIPGFEEQQLQSISGVNTTTTGNPGQLTSIKIQGAPTDYNRVLWNGLSLSESMVDASLIPFSTGKVEVIKGVHCAEYGNIAIGGVVNILPFSMPEEQEGGLKLSGGNYIQSGHLWWRQKTKDGFSLQQHLEKNIFHGKNTIPKRYQGKYSTVKSSETDKGYFLNQLSFQNHHAKGKLQIGLLKSTSTGSNISHSNLFTFCDSRSKRTLQIYALDLEGINEKAQPFLKILKTKLISQDFSPYQNGNSASTYGPENSKIKTGVKIKRDILLFEPLLEYHHNVWNTSGVNQKKNDEYAFVQGIHLDKDTFKWKNWVRAHKANHYDTIYAISSSVLKNYNDTELSAHFGTGFNIPDLYKLNDKKHGNKNLKHESAYGGNLGISQHTILGTFSVLVFKTNYKHQIVQQNQKYQNINKSRQEGFEIGWKKKINKAWMMELSGMYVDSVSLNPKRRLLNVPRTSANGKIIYEQDDLTVGFGCRYTGTQVQPDFEQYTVGIKRGGYPVCFGDIQYKFKEHATWFVNIENAFNRKIENPIGYRNPGFQINTGVSITW
ncbi:MAG: TonB-dependent receptor plug domain-containing protein [Pseudomonadota bacterium]|jgi:vitamin B12 transporter|nr:TonB-dependent receptor [Alphaproteobacteria bacterium]